MFTDPHVKTTPADPEVEGAAPLCAFRGAEEQYFALDQGSTRPSIFLTACICLPFRLR